MTQRSCLVLGATGLVGGHLLDLLGADAGYGPITALSRRPLPAGRGAGRVTEVLCDLGRPETYADRAKADDVFCCLGTTIKKAGSKEAFRQVDHDYPLAAARTALAAGADQFLIVTAVGADANSTIFYNRVKGEVEAALSALPFPGGVKILRPSMLLGERGESRPLERAGAVFMRATRGLFAGPLTRYRAIEAADVARALVTAARRREPGVQIYEGDRLFALLP